MGAVGKISIVFLLFLFAIYIGGHLAIGKYKDKLEKMNTSKPGNLEVENNLKFAKLAFKWFPAAYLVLAIFIMYVS